MSKKIHEKSPTKQVYGGFEDAYNHFNKQLFGGKLPPCLITVRAGGKRSLGYYSPERFGTRIKGGHKDEIAINIKHFQNRTVVQTYSTLVHEMVHLWQNHQGTPSRSTYHNHEWADEMERVGLMPSDTGEPGGARVGWHMTHYVIPGGLFDNAFKAKKFKVPYFDRATDDKKAKKAMSVKTTYVCAGCENKVWGKAGMNLSCGDCEITMDEGVS